jgi:hypothetical protein
MGRNRRFYTAISSAPDGGNCGIGCLKWDDVSGFWYDNDLYIRGKR